MDLIIPLNWEHNHWTVASLVTLTALQNFALCGGGETDPASQLSSLPISTTIAPASSYHNESGSGAADTLTIKKCEECKSGSGKACSGDDHGKCSCSSEGAVCECREGWIGDACQYKIAKVSCEKLRSCILCQVHGVGPLADRRDCDFYCHRSYPVPLIVKNLHFQNDEHLCSFIYHRHHHHTLQNQSTPSKHLSCRYFFKYGKVKADGSLDPSHFYVVAQQEMHCGAPAKFPPLLQANSSSHRNKNFHLVARNYEETVKDSELDEAARRNRFFTVVAVFVFVALPFVACIFALIYNFTSLPCGLCNMFRQSSSKYLRNVRPYPGLFPAEQATMTTAL